MAVDAGGGFRVAGGTTSFDFPVTPGAAQNVFGGGFLTGDAFCARFTHAGALAAATYLGGSFDERGSAVALLPDSSTVLAGTTISADFPVTPLAFDASFGGGFDADGFVARLAPDLASRTFATFVGGAAVERIDALAVGADGAVTFAGASTWADFPTTAGAAFPVRAAGKPWDGVVARLAPDGTALVFGSFLGGSGDDAVRSLTLDQGGRVHLGGATDSTDFPLSPDALQLGLTGGAGRDGFVATLTADGAALPFAVRLGGGGDDEVLGLAVDSAALLRACGRTTSTDLPLAGPSFGPAKGAGAGPDAFLHGLDLCPGTWSDVAAGCADPTTGLVPRFLHGGCAAAGFAVTITIDRAPPFQLGLLLVGTGAGSLPLTPSCTLHLAPLVPQRFPFLTGPAGSFSFTEMLHQAPLAGDWSVQAVVRAPGPPAALAATNAVRLHVP